MKPLIIVESFTKTKTINKYLNNEYDVICSLGHFQDLPKNELGIDTKSWTGHYVPTNPKIIKNIREHVKKSNKIYIASDPDMEGEAIAHHVKTVIQDLLKDKECFRIEFHEITNRAIHNALENPRQINKYIVEAQESRRFVDRLVGYKLSPLLWEKFEDNFLSVGRVQSVALSMCKEMYEKIQNHEINPQWIILAITNHLEFRLYQDDKLYEAKTKEEVLQILQKLDLQIKFSITHKETNSSESPNPPYTTTTLQQDAYNKHHFSSKKTMQLAQVLYESGYITYMRTDSTHIANDFKNKIIQYINETYPPELAKFRSYKTKVANAQEAHEAIRVTDVYNKTINLSQDHQNLYELIWKRTVASQMINAEYTNIEVQMIFEKLPYTFITKKSFLSKQGYLLIYSIPLGNIEEFKKGLTSIKIKHFKAEAIINNPPTLYNEISLIKALEKEGIGRPSTYTSIIEKILTKKYVEKGSNPQREIKVIDIFKSKTGIVEKENSIKTGGKQKDLFVPTEIGIKIINYLQEKVPFLLDVKFTSNMENALDKVCDHTVTKKSILDDFYNDYLIPVVPQTVTIKSQPNKTSGIIKTKYGYCYYHAIANKYLNIESYLNWKQKSAEDLTLQEINFLKTLPKILEDKTELHLGPYGFYIKDKNKNIRLDKSKWDSFIV